MRVGTLDARYTDRVAEFARLRRELADRGAPPEEVAALEAEELAYVLDAVPFIREYTADAPAATEEGPNKAKSAGALAGFVEVTHTSNKQNILQRYMMHVEKRVDSGTVSAVAAHDARGCHRAPEAEYFCRHCDGGMTFHARESMLVCRSCGACAQFTEMNANNLTYEQEIHQGVVTYFAYKRLNHFCEWLNSLQAKVSLHYFLGTVQT